MLHVPLPTRRSSSELGGVDTSHRLIPSPASHSRILQRARAYSKPREDSDLVYPLPRPPTAKRLTEFVSSPTSVANLIINIHPPAARREVTALAISKVAEKATTLQVPSPKLNTAWPHPPTPGSAEPILTLLSRNHNEDLAHPTLSSSSQPDSLAPSATPAALVAVPSQLAAGWELPSHQALLNGSPSATNSHSNQSKSVHAHAPYLPKLLLGCPLILILVLLALWGYFLQRTNRLRFPKYYYFSLRQKWEARKERANLTNDRDGLAKQWPKSPYESEAKHMMKGLRNKDFRSSKSQWVPVDSVLNLSTTGWMKWDAKADKWVPVDFGSAGSSPEPRVEAVTEGCSDCGPARSRDSVSVFGFDGFDGFDGLMDVGEGAFLERLSGNKGRKCGFGSPTSRGIASQCDDEWSGNSIELKEMDTAKIVCERVGPSIV